MAESTGNPDRRALLLAWLLVGAVILISVALHAVEFTASWPSAADRRLALAGLTALLALLAGVAYLGLRAILGVPMARTALVSLVPTVLFAQLAGLLSLAGSTRPSPALLFAAAGLGAAFGLSWGHWSGRQLRAALTGAALAMAAAAGIIWLNRRLCDPECLLSRQGIAALNGGLVGLALAVGVAPAFLGLGPPELARISESYRRRHHAVRLRPGLRCGGLEQRQPHAGGLGGLRARGAVLPGGAVG